jgi:hypothetical protein
MRVSKQVQKRGLLANTQHQTTDIRDPMNTVQRSRLRPTMEAEPPMVPFSKSICLLWSVRQARKVRQYLIMHM